MSLNHKLNFNPDEIELKSAEIPSIESPVMPGESVKFKNYIKSQCLSCKYEFAIPLDIQQAIDILIVNPFNFVTLSVYHYGTILANAKHNWVLNLHQDAFTQKQKDEMGMLD